MTKAKTRIVPTVETRDGTREEIHALPTDSDYLEQLLRYIFDTHWKSIVFGPLIEGGAYEFRCPCRPRSITMFDGYLTVHFGGAHFHLCIGENLGSESRPTPAGLRRARRTSRAEIVRSFDAEGAPILWQLRMFNGEGTPQLNVFFPSPFLTDDDQLAARPDWSRLAVWDDIATRFLGRDAAQDPLDRSGKGFRAP